MNLRPHGCSSDLFLLSHDGHACEFSVPMDGLVIINSQTLFLLGLRSVLSYLDSTARSVQLSDGHWSRSSTSLKHGAPEVCWAPVPGQMALEVPPCSCSRWLGLVRLQQVVPRGPFGGSGLLCGPQGPCLLARPVSWGSGSSLSLPG